MTPISEITEALISIQDNPSLEGLAYVVPISIAAIHRSGFSAAEIETRVERAMINELNAALSGSPDAQMVQISNDDLDYLLNALGTVRAGLEEQGMAPSHRLVSLIERLRKELNSR